jgi:mannose-6-phosphate isomerase-like protein (cupin superfamily)
VTAYTLANLESDVEDQAPKYGMAPDLAGHFARQALDCESSGMSYQKLAPDFRLPFGHTHRKQEEIYVILSGGGRMKIEDEIVELTPLDAVRVSAGTWRGFEAGPDGMELVAFGARCGMGPEDNDGDMEQGWWSD